MNFGYEMLLPYRNPSITWLGFLDPANSLEADIKISSNLYLIAWKLPKIVWLLKKMKLTATDESGSVAFHGLLDYILFK